MDARGGRRPSAIILSLLLAYVGLTYVVAMINMAATYREVTKVDQLPAFLNPFGYAMATLILCGVSVLAVAGFGRKVYARPTEQALQASVATAFLYYANVIHSAIEASVRPDPVKKFDVAEILILGAVSYVVVFVFLFVVAIVLSSLTEPVHEG